MKYNKLFLLRIIKKILSHKFIKFVMVGVITFLLTLGITYFFTEILNIFYLLSYFMVLSLVTLWNFFMNTFFIFKTKKNHKKRIIHYSISVIIFLLLNTFTVKFLTEYIRFYYIVSIIISTIFFILLKFIVYNHLIFKDDSFFYKG
jgi:putative flippase GtrA